MTWYQRHVNEYGLWAVLMSPPCVYCILTERHAHLLRPDGQGIAALTLPIALLDGSESLEEWVRR